jgi:Ribonuclease G/E
VSGGALRVLLDPAIGETRAAVLRDGRPERLLIRRDDGTDPRLRQGAGVRGRLRARGAGVAFVDLGDGREAVLTGATGALAEGAAVDLEITAEPRRDKAATARLLGPAAGPPALLRPAPDLPARLAAWAPGVAVETGPAARAVIDLAVEEALAIETRLPGGGRLTIEPTRALVAVDVDVADARGQPGSAGAGRQTARRLNLTALAETARRLRLSGLGGLVVIDLIGADLDGEEIRTAARSAFAPDAPGVTIGPVTRFGALELARPWRETPLRETLLDPDGRPSALTAALALLRAIERAGAADPGARLLARAAPETAEAAALWSPNLVERLGARFEIVADLAFARARFDVGTR